MEEDTPVQFSGVDDRSVSSCNSVLRLRKERDRSPQNSQKKMITSKDEAETAMPAIRCSVFEAMAMPATAKVRDTKPNVAEGVVKPTSTRRMAATAIGTRPPGFFAGGSGGRLGSLGG